ncbi:MAG: hypothetical protein IK027_00745 [Deltaproteobacteria bacterium]|nr:hypothetical protein [Deltaproteobacteria bacterium]
MKKFFRCLFAALCTTGLSIPALADALLPGVGEAVVYLLLLSIAVIAVAILILILSNRRK